MASFIDKRKQELSESERIADRLTDTNLLSGGATRSSVGDLARVAELGLSLAARKRGHDQKAEIATQRQQLMDTENRLLGESERIFETWQMAQEQGKSVAEADRLAQKELKSSTASAIERDFIRAKMSEFGFSPLQQQVNRNLEREQNQIDRVEREFGEIPSELYSVLPALHGKDLGALSSEDMNAAIFQAAEIQGKEFEAKKAEEERIRNINADASTRLQGHIKQNKADSQFMRLTITQGLGGILAQKEELSNLPQAEREQQLDALRISQVTNLKNLRADLGTRFGDRIEAEGDAGNRSFLKDARDGNFRVIDDMISFYESSTNEDIQNLEQTVDKLSKTLDLDVMTMFPGTMRMRKAVGNEAFAIMSQNMWNVQTVAALQGGRDIISQEFQTGVANMGRMYGDVASVIGTGTLTAVAPENKEAALQTSYSGVMGGILATGPNGLDLSKVTAEQAGNQVRVIGLAVKESIGNAESYDNTFEAIGHPRFQKVLSTATEGERNAFYDDHMKASNSRMVNPANGILRNISDLNNSPSGSKIQFDTASNQFVVDVKIDPGIGLQGEQRAISEAGAISDAQELAAKANKYLKYMQDSKGKAPSMAGISDQQLPTALLMQVSPHNFNIPINGTLTKLGGE